MYTRVFDSVTIFVLAGPSKDFSFSIVAKSESFQLLVDFFHATLEHVHRVIRRGAFASVIVVVRVAALTFGFIGCVQLQFYLLGLLLESVQLFLGLVLCIVGLALPLFLSSGATIP